MSSVKIGFAAAAVVIGISAWLGCGASGDDASSDDSAITSSNCSIFNNQTAKAITPDELQKLDDPIAKKLLAAGSCPSTYSQVLDKLKTTDNKNCKDINDPKTDQGLGSFFVSETAEFAGSVAAAAKDGFRTVTIKTCDGRGSDEMLFSSSANVDGVGETSIEMIGKDATTGVYDFYEIIEGNQWVFYGTSADFIGNGYECGATGFCKSLNSKKASSPSGKSCASCHISGGLIMKELESPWLHWTAGHQKGSEPVAKKFASKFGDHNTGEELEGVVGPSFDSYGAKRVEILAAKGVEELVRPLFCTMDINLSSNLVGSNLVLDAELGFGTFKIDPATYRGLKKEVKQHIVGAPASVDDTAQAFTYPTRGKIDTAYASALEDAKLIDQEFFLDVLDVDFTRPIFSGQRCGLLKAISGKTTALDGKLASFAKEADKSKRDALAADIARGIPALFADALKGGTTPAEATFLANLTDPKQNVDAHQRDATSFLDACQKRLASATDQKTATKDLMTYAAHVRAVMRRDIAGFNGQELLEPGQNGDNKMVFDNLGDNPNALDPRTCRLPPK